MKIGTHKTHPAADAFPMMDPGQFKLLAADVRDRGQLESIKLVRVGDEDLVLDGRNRYKACLMFGVEPRFEHYEGTDPVGYVVTLNMRRRHLDESQRAMVAARLATLRDGQRQVGQLAEVPTQEAAAAMVNVGERSVRRAREVLAKGTPELAQAVERGDVAVSQAAQMTKLEPAEQREVVARVRASRAEGKEVNPKQVARQMARAKVAEQIRSEDAPLPAGPFRVIVADPPRQYDKRAGDGTQRGQVTYPTMSLAEICALPVAAMAHKDCVLWLWTTNAHLLTDDAKILEAWGFTAKTILTWDKEHMGNGDWLRGQTEHAILAVRGKPTVTLTNETTIIHEARREHSRKPEAFYSLVERLCPGSKVELFAREKREGWTSHGAELGKFAPPEPPPLAPVVNIAASRKAQARQQHRADVASARPRRGAASSKVQAPQSAAGRKALRSVGKLAGKLNAPAKGKRAPRPHR